MSRQIKFATVSRSGRVPEIFQKIDRKENNIKGKSEKCKFATVPSARKFPEVFRKFAPEEVLQEVQRKSWTRFWKRFKGSLGRGSDRRADRVKLLGMI